MAKFSEKRIGYGQVEPNQLSAQKTGQIYASLPLADEVTVLQNGEFMYYDYKSGTVTNSGVGEPMLVFNEIKVYEDYLAVKDFAMIRVGDNYVTNAAAVGRITSANVDGTTYADGSLTEGVSTDHVEYGYRMNGIAPRLFKTNIGDVMTTNMIEADLTDALAVDTTKGVYFTPVANTTTKTLVLTQASAIPASGMCWVLAKDYTMPDGQHGVKLQRIQ